MNYANASTRLNEYRQQIADLRKQMRATQAEVEPQEVSDYEFSTLQGSVRLSQLFGDHRDLIVVHNMGSSCPACTMWADGYNGVHHHIVTRAAFVVSSPELPQVQQKFAEGRGWKFPMVSHAGTSFAEDMGYKTAKGWMPGISVFQRRGDKIVRVSDTGFRPGDDFCTVWHMFDLLPNGAGDWRPRFKY